MNSIILKIFNIAKKKAKLEKTINIILKNQKIYFLIFLNKLRVL